MLHSFCSTSSSGPPSLSDATSQSPLCWLLSSFLPSARKSSDTRHGIVCSDGNLHAFCFPAQMAWTQGRVPELRRKTGWAQKSLLPRSHPGDHWSCQHLGSLMPVPPSISYSLPLGLCVITDTTGAGSSLWFLPACLFLCLFQRSC